ANIVEPYDKYYVFMTMFELACISEDFSFREKVAKVIHRMYNPIGTIWPGVAWSNMVPAYNSIDVNYINELEINLKRIHLLE
ncbi:hypothetical protein GOP47_0006611, partial [Adiantum capillus-veneris]